MSETSQKPRIRAILSDWVKVVVDDGDNRATSTQLSLYSSFDAETVHAIMFEELREVFAAHMRGQISTACYRKTMMRALLLRCTDSTFDRAFTDVFIPNEALIDLWKGMRAQGIRMVAASNIEELRHIRLMEMGVHGLFDAHCLSYQTGLSKPSPQFFHEALVMAHVERREALFVDDLPQNVEAATRLGMHGYVYDRTRHADFERFLGGFTLTPHVSA